VRALVTALSMLAALLATEACPASGEAPRFRSVAPGIEHTALEANSGTVDAFSGHAFRVDLGVAELRLVPAAGGRTARQTVDQIVAGYPAAVAVNASFFDQEGRTMGLAVDEARVMATGKRENWGALVVDAQEARIVLGSDIRDHSEYRLIVQGIPRLLVGGVVPRLKPQVAERTAVCAEGRTVMLVVSTKVEATAFARFLADSPARGGLGCSHALNLDGGLSTQLVARLAKLTLSVPGGWGVPNALVAIPGKR
jgi:hypothetical protein